MGLGFTFFFNSILLGVGLAMDAFSVSLANGLSEPCMKKGKMAGVAGIFSEKCIPWIALLLLGYIGGKMLYEGITNKDSCEEKPSVGLAALLVQGVATSIDALSVGFTIADHDLIEAVLACLLIGAVTFFICFAGILIGKKAGTKLAGKAGILGGAILVFIGLEIFITSWF